MKKQTKRCLYIVSSLAASLIIGGVVIFICMHKPEKPVTNASANTEFVSPLNSTATHTIPDSTESNDTEAPTPLEETTEPTDNTEKGKTPATERKNPFEQFITEKPTEPVTEQPTGMPNEHVTERQTEKPTERTTERVTEKPTERTTEGGTTKPTEKPTERTTEKVTEKPTEKTTEAPKTCSHNWVWATHTETVHHEAKTGTYEHLVEAPWIEYIKEKRIRCNGCKTLYKTIDEYVEKDPCATSWSSVTITVEEIEHPAVYETVTDVLEPAWDEEIEVKDYQYCSKCGEKK